MSVVVAAVAGAYVVGALWLWRAVGRFFATTIAIVVYPDDEGAS